MTALVEYLFWKCMNNDILYNDILCMECVFEDDESYFEQCMYDHWNKGKTSCGSLLIIWYIITS